MIADSEVEFLCDFIGEMCRRGLTNAAAVAAAIVDQPARKIDQLHFELNMLRARVDSLETNDMPMENATGVIALQAEIHNLAERIDNLNPNPNFGAF